MKSIAEWMDEVVNRAGKSESDSESALGLMVLIEKIQADALAERRLRIEAAAVTGLMASARAPNGAMYDSPSRIAEIARTMAAHMLPEPVVAPGSRGPAEPVLTIDLFDDCRAFLANLITEFNLEDDAHEPDDAGKAKRARAQHLLKKLDARRSRS